MRRPEADYLYINSFPFSEGFVKQLVETGNSEEVVKTILSKENCVFSDESIRNLTIVLSVYKMIKFPSRSIFFIYGSTAKGTAKAGERIQEFQFWEEERFLGSCFRRKGGSDIDLRIITQDREEILPSLRAIGEGLKKLRLGRRIELRVDAPSYVAWEATRADTSSFFRRVLTLNQPLVLHGREELGSITRLAYSYLKPEDYANETQRIKLKQLVLKETAEKSFVFWTENQLLERFPSFYSPLQLKAQNSERYPSPVKVSLVDGESSLVVVPVDNAITVNKFITNLQNNPDASAKQLTKDQLD